MKSPYNLLKIAKNDGKNLKYYVILISFIREKPKRLQFGRNFCNQLLGQLESIVKGSVSSSIPCMCGLFVGFSFMAHEMVTKKAKQ